MNDSRGPGVATRFLKTQFCNKESFLVHSIAQNSEPAQIQWRGLNGVVNIERCGSFSDYFCKPLQSGLWFPAVYILYTY